MSVTVDIDLRNKLGEARDQKQRPTCLVFAASSAHEASRPVTEYLSVEYLFYIGAQRSHQDPNRGLTQSAVQTALQENGQPTEAAWPYQHEAPEAANWKPPAITAPYHRATLDFGPRTTDEVRDVLSAGTPVLLVLELTLAMYIPESGGLVRLRTGDSVTTRRHAVLAVGSGHADDGEYVLVRNSWGLHWGHEGHGWLHQDYVSAHVHTTAVIS